MCKLLGSGSKVGGRTRKAFGMVLAVALFCGTLMVAGCSDEDTPGSDIPDVVGEDVGEIESPMIDSAALAALNDSLRVVDSIRSVFVRDSIACVDSIASAIETARLLDSLQVADSLAYIRIVDSLAAAKALREIEEAEARYKFLVDSIATAKADSIALALAALEGERRQIFVKDSIEEARRIEREQFVADSIAAENKRLAEAFEKIPEQVRNTIGRGYDITGLYAHRNSVKYPILDIKKLAGAGIIIRDGAPSYDGRIIEGATITKYQEKLSERSDLNLKGDFGAWGVKASFSAQIKKTFESDKTGSEEYSFATVSAVSALEGYIVNKAWNLEQYFTDEFKENLEKMTADNIVEYYGTHVLLSGMFGGRIEYNMSVARKSTTSNVSLSKYAAYSAKASGWGQSISADFTNEEKQEFNNSFESSKTTITVVSIAGANENADRVMSEGALQDGWNSWMGSINRDNMTLCEFYSNSLVSIVDLVPANRKTEIEDAIRNRFGIAAIEVRETLRTSSLLINTGTQLFHPGSVDNPVGDRNMNASNTEGSVNWWVDVTSVKLMPDGRSIEIIYDFTIEEGKGDRTKFVVSNNRVVGEITKLKGRVVSIEPSSLTGVRAGSYNTHPNWEMISVSNNTIVYDGQIKASRNSSDRFGFNITFRIDFVEAIPEALSKKSRSLSLSR